MPKATQGLTLPLCIQGRAEKSLNFRAWIDQRLSTKIRTEPLITSDPGTTRSHSLPISIRLGKWDKRRRSALVLSLLTIQKRKHKEHQRHWRKPGHKQDRKKNLSLTEQDC